MNEKEKEEYPYLVDQHKRIVLQKNTECIAKTLFKKILKKFLSLFSIKIHREIVLIYITIGQAEFFRRIPSVLSLIAVYKYMKITVKSCKK